ncbi:hypothetical protein OJAV_G00213420 [Oryzias javanicus]|uniref:WW domain-containing protein n=1 Tax=Oryzias javanicus TaxID=123683 RepID=A0A437C3I2_ORYJA|nr:hypothetical protein OJAV_G00213420 [Oryzias javanicus]
MIKLLPPEVQGQLRSGVAIPSLQQCVEELVLNSIDAGATCVGVRMDLEAFKVQVIDNGAGMNAEDMGRVGNRYHTSKCGSLEDLENIKFHGFRGEALASIVSMATLVEISSRPRASAKTHVKLFKDGKGVDVFEAENDRPSAGTTVIICNFFHNMPVRRRRLDPVLEGERVRQRVEAVSLMHPSVSFTLKNDSTGAMMVQLPKAKSTYHRFLQIHGLTRAEKLGEICHTYKQFEAEGYLGREGHYNNSLQFLYVNERLMLKTRIHKLLNLLLRRLRQKPDTSDGSHVLKSPKNKQTHELFGVYVLNIKCSYSEYDICFEPAKTLIEFKDWEEVLLCVEEAVKTFLRRENLTSEFSQEDLECVSSKVFAAPRADQEVDQTRAAPPDISTMDCSVGMKLASELVHRRRTDGTEEDGSTQHPPNAVEYAGSSPHHRTSPHQAGNEEDSASSVWLHHYNMSIGKTVYVNRMTGLSRYDDPAEETQVPCTSDVSNMAVSVISETGMEYRCYPFQLAVVLPFLPKSRSGRLISSGLDCGDAATESSNSLSVMYSKWKNPVFVQPPEVGVDISGGQADGLVVKIHSVLFPYRLSKAMIHSMKVIDQVDKKFLACLINTSEEELALDNETEGNLLVLVDQHAAHERVRLENLITDSYEDIPETFGEKWLCSSSIVPPLEISVTEEELRLLSSCRSQSRSLGLEVTFSETQTRSVFVGKVPRCFLEKETNELKRGRPSIIKTVVEEYLQEQIELLRSTGRAKGTLPITVLKVLASLACHGAVKFNDVLNRDECHSLVASLSSCQLPFQCAHGRPSIAPLVDINHLDEEPKDSQKPNLKKLRRMYGAWQLQGNI